MIFPWFCILWSWSLILAINHAEEGSNYEEGEIHLHELRLKRLRQCRHDTDSLISNIHGCGRGIETFQHLATFPRDLHFSREWAYDIWQNTQGKVNLHTVYVFSCGLVFHKVWCCFSTFLSQDFKFWSQLSSKMKGSAFVLLIIAVKTRCPKTLNYTVLLSLKQDHCYNWTIGTVSCFLFCSLAVDISKLCIVTYQFSKQQAGAELCQP